MGPLGRLAGAGTVVWEDPAPVAAEARGTAGTGAPVREDPPPVAAEGRGAPLAALPVAAARVGRHCGCWLAYRPVASAALRRRLLGAAGGLAGPRLLFFVLG